MKKKTNGDHAKGLLMKAENDFTLIRLALENEGPYDGVCFHAQQAIEKMLKAILAFHDHVYPKTHQLSRLQSLCLEVDPTLLIQEFEFEQISAYATGGRYDEFFEPEFETAQLAYETALEVRKIVYHALPSTVHPELKKDNH